jgi:hypothetical protein
MIFSQF